jgi:hypothetical protein
MSKNVVEPERPQPIWRTRVARWIINAPRAQEHARAPTPTNAPTDTAKVVSWTRLNVTLYAHCLSCWYITHTVPSVPHTYSACSGTSSVCNNRQLEPGTRCCCVQLTVRSRVLPEKLTSFQLLKKVPAFCATLRFIAAFKTVRHPSSSWAISTQSIVPVVPKDQSDSEASCNIP